MLILWIVIFIVIFSTCCYGLYGLIRLINGDRILD